MLHILLTILKILGIALLVLLAVILLLILIVLFVPVRYRLTGQKDQDIINGRVRVSWLFGILACVILYKDKKADLKVKILGLNIMGLFKRSDSKKNTKEITSNKKDTKKDLKYDNKTENIINNKDEQNISSLSDNTNADVKEDKEKKNFILKIRNFIQKIKSSISKLKLTIKNIYDKINYWKDFISDQRTKDALICVKKHLIKMIKHIMPKRLKGSVVYGFDDPCKTGQILAGVSVFYPLYYKHLTLCPDFSGSVLNGYVDLKGRIYVVFFIKTALQILFDKNIQFIIHTFRNKEES